MSPQTLSFPDWWVGGRERRRCYWTWWKNFFRVDEQIVAEMKRFTLGLSSAPVTQNMKTNYQGTVNSCLPKRWVTQRVEFSWSTEQNFLHLNKHTRISHQLNHCTTNMNFRPHKYLSISSTSPNWCKPNWYVMNHARAYFCTSGSLEGQPPWTR